MNSKKINSSGSNKTFWLVGGIVAAIAVMAIVAIASQSGTKEVVQGVDEFHAVEVSGDVLPAYADGAADKAIGMTAPILTGAGFTGNKIVTSPGAPTLLMFLAHWCPHCNAEVPRLLTWKNSGAVPADLDVIGVATAVSAGAANYPPAEWFSNKGWAWLVLVDESTGDGTAGKAAQAYGASGWPYFVIVGADGKVKTRVSGEVEVSELESIVEAALAS